MMVMRRNRNSLVPIVVVFNLFVLLGTGSLFSIKACKFILKVNQFCYPGKVPNSYRISKRAGLFLVGVHIKLSGKIWLGQRI